MLLNNWRRSLVQAFAPTSKRNRAKRPTSTRFRPQVLSLEDRVVPAVFTFSNPGLITINDSAPATPYPSDILVSGVTGLTGDVDVQLNGFGHTFPSDVGFLLVGPTGVNIYIMDAAGGSDTVTGLTLAFDDEAAFPIPDVGPLTSGSYQCASYFPDFFDPPAPAPSGSTRLSDFDNLDANGTWSLYVQDFVGGDVGTVDNGWTITITTVNFPPTISDITNQTINEDTNTGALAFTVGDVETPPGSLTVTGTSSNLALVPNGNIVFGGAGANRTVTVTPLANQSGTTTITVTVNDGTSTATDTFLLTVNPVNDAPTISNILDRTINENTTTGAIPFTVGDIDNSVFSLTLTGGSSNTTLVPIANIVFGGAGANRTVTVTPAVGQNGTATITVTVSDGTNTAFDTFILTVNAIPTISNIVDQVTNEDTSTGAIPFTIGDVETPAGSLVLTRNSSNLVLVPTANIIFGGSGANRTVTVTPAANQFGTSTITVIVTDGAGQSSQDTFVVTVNPINDAPVAVIVGLPANPPFEGTPLTFTGSQTDVDSTAWTYQWSVANTNGQVIAPGNAQNFSFTPDENGTYTVTLVVTDNGSGPSAPLSGNLVSAFTVINARPVPSPGNPYRVFANGSVQLLGSVTDPGTRDTFVLRWDLDGDGVFGETGVNAPRGNETLLNPVYFAPSASVLTTLFVSLQATDDDGGTRTRLTSVTVFPRSARFDFNAASQVTDPGAVGVRGSDLFSSDRGHGWASAVSEFDNTGPTALLRDGHLGTDNTFSVSVVPNATYQVTVWFRDVVNRLGINVFAEGILRASGVRVTGSLRVSDLVPGGFNATVTLRFDVTSADGTLDLRFRGVNGNPFFIVNGVQLVKK